MSQFTLTEDQSEALNKLIDFTESTNRVFTLEGYAGTGKSTVMIEFAKKMMAQRRRLFLTAPTNKAVKVLKDMCFNESLYKVPCKTIYSLLNLKLLFEDEIVTVNYNEKSDNNSLKRDDIIIIDEASMVCKDLFAFIQSLFTRYSKIQVIFVGDSLQLPPINEDSALPFSMYDDNFKLSSIIRQSADNPILSLTEHIRDCITNGTILNINEEIRENYGVYVIEDETRFEDKMKTCFSSSKYTQCSDAYRSIAWTNSVVEYYNSFIREQIYGKDACKEKYIENETMIVSRPIMLARDTSQVAINTDEEVVIDKIDYRRHPIYSDFTCKCLTVLYSNSVPIEIFTLGECKYDMKKKFYDTFYAKLNTARKQRRGAKWKDYYNFVNSFGDVTIRNNRVHFDNIRPAHALTSHKSQGSTFDEVFINSSNILQNKDRNTALKCLYVAVSRAKTSVHIYK